MGEAKRMSDQAEAVAGAPSEAENKTADQEERVLTSQPLEAANDGAPCAYVYPRTGIRCEVLESYHASPNWLGSRHAYVAPERPKPPLFDILRLVVAALNASTSEERFALSKAAQDALAAAAGRVDRPRFSKEDVARATTALFGAATRGETLANQVRAALCAIGEVEDA